MPPGVALEQVGLWAKLLRLYLDFPQPLGQPRALFIERLELARRFEFGLELVLGSVAPRFFTSGEALVLVGGGAGLGLIGSTAALSEGWRR